MGVAISNQIKLEKKVASLEDVRASKDRDISNTEDYLNKTKVIQYSNFDVTNFEGVDICTICANFIPHYVPDYFFSEKINHACLECKKGSQDIHDPFISFPDPGMPVSLVSHWYPVNIAISSLSSIASMRSHYSALPNPGSSFLSVQETLQEWKLMWDQERQQMKEDCKQS